MTDTDKIPTIRPGLAWELTTVSELLKDLNEPTLINRGQKDGKPLPAVPVTACYFKHRGQTWKLERILDKT